MILNFVHSCKLSGAGRAAPEVTNVISLGVPGNATNTTINNE